MNKYKILFSALLLFGAVFLFAACAPAATPVPATAVPAPVAPTSPPPTTAPTAAPAPQAKAVTLQIVQNDKLGKFLADGDGRTLYLFTKDTANVSNCNDKCPQTWPPVLPADKPTLKDGVTESLVGTTKRQDGSTQLTYNGWPIYYYTPDKAPGDTNGQGINKFWWVVSGEGNIIKPSGLQIVTNDKLGKFLADENGRTVYAFMKDTKDTSTCVDKCEVAWPPLLALGQPALKDGVNASMVGTITRKDGSKQITYNGMPVYYYFKDAAPGDTTGQGVGTVWYVVSAEGAFIK